ncbi:hypothetical protein [Solihabitans fulvus]|uniref:hypothetical protein n=1 Tax=Solihabitans fulvus TaxID=1892852 RepID=UPI001661DAE7|nr:hypothetical protein [Solihabitans fulvus]
MPVVVTRSTWSDDGVSFDVYREDTGQELTLEESFDAAPTSDQIATLIVAFENQQEN